MFDVKKFTTPTPYEPVLVFWGNGHSPRTDPTRKGWRCRPVKGLTSTWLVGQVGVEGCASIVFISGKLDVAFYEALPEEVHKHLKSGKGGLDPLFQEFAPTAGVGLQIIAVIKNQLRLI